MSERSAFWERARRESVLLTQGMLLDQHLVSLGAVDAAATPDVDTWGTIEGITDLTSDAPAESTYYRGGGVPLATALGPDADIEDQEAVVSEHDPTDLLPFAVCNEVIPRQEPSGL